MYKRQTHTREKKKRKRPLFLPFPLFEHEVSFATCRTSQGARAQKKTLLPLSRGRFFYINVRVPSLLRR